MTKTVEEYIIQRTYKTIDDCIVWVPKSRKIDQTKWGKVYEVNYIQNLMWLLHHGEKSEFKIYQQCATNDCVNPEHWAELHKNFYNMTKFEFWRKDQEGLIEWNHEIPRYKHMPVRIIGEKNG